MDEVPEDKSKAEERETDGIIPLGSLARDLGAETKGNRIPRPAPHDVDMSLTPMDEPLSSDTISMRRPAPEKQGVSLEPEKRLKIVCYKCAQKLDLTEMEPFSQVSCPSCHSAIIVPRWFDNYLLEEECGEGGMAKVYRGLDLALDREIAIKILNLDIANEADKSKLFLHEARTAATLNHYALLPIYTCGQFENQPYIVMQYMAGGSLDKEIMKFSGTEKVSIDDAIKWMHDATEGLDNARRHGIVHHDIKPGNLMLDEDGALKIGDFGISQAMRDSRSEEISQLTKMWVSPDYVSPEKVVTGKETYLGDIYSLGASFYHVLTGKTPFDYNSYDELFKTKTVRDPVDIRKLRDDIPEPLGRLIMSMMSRTPEARPSYRDIVAELNALSKSMGVSSRKGSKRKSSAATKATKPKIQTIHASSMPRLYVPRRKSGGVLGVIVKMALAVAFLAGCYYLWINGYLDKFPGMSFSDERAGLDYFPEITSNLSSGRSGTASILAERALDSPGMSHAARKQAALQMVIATFLSNDSNAKGKATLTAESLRSAGVERHDPVLSLLRYMSAGPIDPQNIREQVASDRQLALVAEVAIFVKNAYDKGDDSVKRDAHRNFSSASPLVDSQFWGIKSFSGRIKAWHDWLFLNSGNAASMEPLMLAIRVLAKSPDAKSPGAPDEIVEATPTPSSAPSKRKADASLQLSMLSAEWLRENRAAFASSRPRPADYNFSDSAIQAYLSSLPKQYAESETERSRHVTPLKNHLIATMLHMPYGDTTIKRKSGSPLSGSFMANRNFISVKLRGSNRRVRVKWNEIPPTQFVAFLEHYAKVRSQATPSG
ncbi:MAG: serine/threonine protein kinase, partial [Victivallales bacterium]|nr:serine/threonine protein kinase [Victivallales bacterium]